MKILVVDDSKTCRNLYRRELQQGGFEVLEAQDGIEALGIVQETPVDLVVLDIEMPNMNGYEVCERLRSKEFTTRFGDKEGLLPVIFVTSNEAVEWRVKGFSKGANGFINKGFKPGTLLGNVNAILNPKNPLSGCRALLVEDSRFLRNMIKTFLEEEQVVVTALDSCERAFELLMHGTDNFDMVITSLEMADMKGDKLCSHIRVDMGLKTLPVLVLTESEDRQMLLSLFEAGATDYLVKPFEKKELITRLKASIEMVRTLKEEVEKKVWKETGPGSELVDAKKAIDQAKLATTILHNVGNVLNSVFASCYQLSHLIKDSKLRQLLLAHKLIEDNEDNLANFITEDPRGKLLPEYLIKSGLRVEDEHACMAREVEEIATKINLMKEIIETQQLHAKTIATELMHLDEMVEDALKVQQENLNKNHVRLICNISSIAPVRVKRAHLTHVLINLIKNAVEAMEDTPQPVLEIDLREIDGFAVLTVRDTGCGISEENLKAIFNHGFTTKEDGHGFGLAFCAKAINDMNGQLLVTSEGINQGAQFSMKFPLE